MFLNMCTVFKCDLQRLSLFCHVYITSYYIVIVDVHVKHGQTFKNLHEVNLCESNSYEPKFHALDLSKHLMSGSFFCP